MGRKQHEYLIRKVVKAESVLDAMKKEKKASVVEVILLTSGDPLVKAIGFTSIDSREA